MDSNATSRRAPVPVWLFALAIAAVVVVYVLGGSAVTDLLDSTTDRSSQFDQPNRFSNLEQITFDDIPFEAVDTIELILSDGPFPFSRDDSVFQNREGLLPDQRRGYYREYTVITPGSDDRGARRIVAGESGDLYYTEDHYQSFSEVVGRGP